MGLRHFFPCLDPGLHCTRLVLVSFSLGWHGTRLQRFRVGCFKFIFLLRPKMSVDDRIAVSLGTARAFES
jgi:hypothetical protein